MIYHCERGVEWTLQCHNGGGREPMIDGETEARIIAVACGKPPDGRSRWTVRLLTERVIELVFLPAYSPDLNPIEYIWKSIKRVISVTFVRDLEYMRDTIATQFGELSGKLSFARHWIEEFMGGKMGREA